MIHTMNEAIIDTLFYGGISAVSRTMHPIPEHASILEEIEKEREYFLSKMSEDDCKRFEELLHRYKHVNVFERRHSFGYGVRLGTMLIYEVFASEDKLA